MSARRSASISVELGGLLSPPLSPRNGLTRGALRREARKLKSVLPELLGPGAASGFAKLPARRGALRSLEQAVRKIRRMKCRDWLHVGIGGSCLGAETVFRALGHPIHNHLDDRERPGPRIHFIDNVDPDRLGAILDGVDLRHTGVHVVSKSGGTVETLAAFQLIREAFERKRGAPKWNQRCVVTTGRGALERLSETEGLLRLEFPEDVGGRFSALTPSGLLTPAVAGVDVASLLAGARAYLARLKKRTLTENAPAMAACAAFLMAEGGKNVHVLMPYADALEPLARWYVQLFAESLGKRSPKGRGRGVGPTPLPGRGTTDQHAQVQLFVEGPNDKLVSFVRVASGQRQLAIPGYAPAEYLDGVALGELLDAEYRGTAIALARADRPTTTWTLPCLDGRSLGALLIALELQVAYQARLYGIDAYDQPGVEAGKVAAYALIGREGYESERAEILESRAPDWTL